MTEQRPATPVDGAAASTERTLGQLVAGATQDLSEIIRAEIALVKAELSRDVKNGAMAGAMIGAAGYLGLLASITAVITAGYALTEAGLPAWAAFSIVTATLLLVAGILALVARFRIRKIGPPERAIRSARKTVAAVHPTGPGR